MQSRDFACQQIPSKNACQISLISTFKWQSLYYGVRWIRRLIIDRQYWSLYNQQSLFNFFAHSDNVCNHQFREPTV